MKAVYLDDSHIDYNLAQEYFEDAANWAKKQCMSYVNYDVTDVSDTSLTCDHVAIYLFTDPKDAVWFELKWKFH